MNPDSLLLHVLRLGKIAFAHPPSDGPQAGFALFYPAIPLKNHMHFCFNCDEVPELIASNLCAFSGSMSHFFLWRGHRILFDCGEGAGIRLDDFVFTPNMVALSHAHADHHRGLQTFCESRAFFRGANDKPLTLIYPGASEAMTACIEALKASRLCVTDNGIDGEDAVGSTAANVKKRIRSKSIPINFIPFASGDAIELTQSRVLQAVEVAHDQSLQLCLAYRIGRMRRRLKAAYSKLPSARIVELKQECARDELEEDYFENELVYSGDCVELPTFFTEGVQVLIHEATFLEPGDADEEKGKHANVLSVLRAAKKGGARHLVLFHSSRRYSIRDFRDGVERLIGQTDFKAPVVLIRGGFQLPVD